MPGNDVDLRIRSLLQNHPKGLTISDIAVGVDLNRNSTAKHLGILEAAGQVESYLVGTAKVFTLARRVPVSALFGYSSDGICTLDQEERILSANQCFLNMVGREPGSAAAGCYLRDVLAPFPGFDNLLANGFSGKEMSGEIRTEKDQRNITLKVRTVPTIFENGTRGTTLLIEDVSKERERLKNLEFLARTSAELADMGDEEDIYRYIAERVRELLPNSTISIGSLDDEKSTLTIMGVAGEPEEFERCRRLLGRDPRGLTFTFASEPLAAEQLAKKTLTECPDLNSLFFSQFPPQITDLMGEIFSFGKGYAMGCVCRGGIFGDVAILLKKGQKLRHRETIEAFIRQASVALQRRHMREKLRRTESQLEALKNQR